QARIAKLPVPLADVQNASDAVRSGRLPTVLPAYRAVHVAIGGEIWIERWPPEGARDSHYFDVMSADGGDLGLIVLPVSLRQDPPPFFTRAAVYGVVADSASGTQYVVRLTLPEISGRAPVRRR